MHDHSILCHEHVTPWGETAWYVGPALDAGPLPLLLYFSLSGRDSLCLPPYNSPVRLLAGEPLRIFSLTLPLHGPHDDPTTALSRWAEAMSRGQNLLEEFFPRALQLIDYLVAEGIADPKHLATAGLSRGGLVATHLAARDHRIRAVCGFAPWVEPAQSQDWDSIADRPEVKALSLFTLIDKLTHTTIRFYVGNQDKAVGTETVFQFIYQLASKAYERRIRSPSAELIVAPSIGHRGHGTSEASFRQGAQWLKERLFEDGSLHSGG